MTLDEFFEELAKIQGWKLLNGMIRRGRCATVCPISAVCNRIKRTHFSSSVGSPASMLGIDINCAWSIAHTSDRDYLSPLRARLLAACKLTVTV